MKSPTIHYGGAVALSSLFAIALPTFAQTSETFTFTDTTLSGLSFVKDAATGGYAVANGGMVENTLIHEPSGFATYAYRAQNVTGELGVTGQYYTTGYTFTLPAYATSIISVSASASYQEASVGVDPNVRMAWARNGSWVTGSLPYIVSYGQYTSAWQNGATTTDTIVAGQGGDTFEFGVFFVNSGIADTESMRDASLDNLTYTITYAVPEPTSALLGCLGLTSLILRRRRVEA